MSGLFDYLRVPETNPALARAQYDLCARQLPLMYAILIVNTAFVIFSHYGTAPFWIGVAVPALLLCACGLRLVQWQKAEHTDIGHPEVIRRLKVTVAIAGVFGCIFSMWAYSLFSYGDMYQQTHIAFYMAVTTTGCVYCLLQVRAAALLVIATTLPVFAVFFGFSGNPIFAAMAVNLLAVSVPMVIVIQRQHNSLAELIETREQLIRRNDETQQLSDMNHALANLDNLTGLPNRRSFFSSLEERSHESIRSCAPFAIGLVDLDGFKSVNDLYGHLAGDLVLAQAARRLTDACGTAIGVARIGGDEFALLLDGAWADESLLALGTKVREALEEPFTVGGVTAKVSGSIGFARWDEQVAGSRKLYENADYALYYAKRVCRNGAMVFSAAHATELRDLNRVDRLLRHADLDAEMSVVFQPVYDVAQARTKSYEALARWTSGTHGQISPDLFIKAAERSGFINRLTPVLLRKMLAAMTDLPAGARVSFNLSACDICSPEAILRIVAIVQESGIDPHRIDFEITETSIMTDFDQSCDALRLLRQMGSRIALDDFGAGYSSLSHIHRLPLDAIKIDRSFIADLDGSDTSRNIVRSVVNLSHDLGVNCVVEGVETARQVEILRGLGISDMQGFFFGRPMPAQDTQGATVIAAA